VKGVESVEVYVHMVAIPYCTKQTHQTVPPRGNGTLRGFWEWFCLFFVLTFHHIHIMTSTKRADFEAIFPSLAQDILAHAKRYNLPQNALEWLEKVGSPSGSRIPSAQLNN